MVIPFFQISSEIVRVHGHDHKLLRFFDKDGTDPLGGIHDPVPGPVKREVFMALKASKLGGRPGSGANGFLDLFTAKAPPVRVA